ncbi:hypothetical protein [uncultured Legionella sp.]|uniref:hypothetical protein n=1 Tax=uncultured Legionella sp. TaxID=210934 RepID=UPI00261EB690|nr:hypothetical protein [uncultured Legionella sp.]
MIQRIINSLLITGIILLSSLAYADAGLFFKITESGPPATIDLVLCLNGKIPASCQNYHVSAQNLLISTVTNRHYPDAGLKILTDGYQPAGCTLQSSPGRYCLFAANNTPVAIHLNSSTQKQNQTLTFTSTAPSNPMPGGTYLVTAAASSGLAVDITVDHNSSSVCSISGSTVTFNATGTCIVNANQAGNAQHHAASQVQQSMTVSQQNQTITFTSVAPSLLMPGNTYNVAATASSGLAVDITVDASSSWRMLNQWRHRNI